MGTARTFSWVFGAACAACAAGSCSEALPDCPTGTKLLGDLCRRTCSSSAECVGGELCTAGACMPGVPNGPAIVLFRATPMEITRPGQQVSLEYEVDADMVEIVPAALPLTGNLLGNVTVAVQNTTTFTLRAYRGPHSVEQNLSVVLAGGGVAITSFTAQPTELKRGERVTLAWETANAAPGSIRITEPEFERVVSTGLPDSGNIGEDVPQVPIEYHLETRGADGSTARAFVQVFDVIDGEPQIKVFNAEPSPIRPGDTSVVFWETRNGVALRLFEKATDITPPVDRFSIARGFTIVGPPETATYDLLIDGGGHTAEQQALLEVVPVPGPLVERFEVEPRVRNLTKGGLNNVEIEWVVSNAEELRLFVNEESMEVGGQGQSQRFQPVNLHVRLAGIARSGTAIDLEATSWWVDPETLQEISGDLTTQAYSATLLDDQRDPEDLYELRAPIGGGELSVFAGDQNGQCNAAIADVMTLDLVDESGMTVILPGEMIDGCDALRGEVPAGNYLARVRATAPVAYAIFGRFHPPACGNGKIDGGEQCDDGNRWGGDLCDGACRALPPPQYSVTEVPGGLSPQPFEGVSRPLRFHEGVAEVVLPFRFQFFNNEYAGLIVHTDGFIALRPEDRAASFSTSLVDKEAPNAVIAPFMADLRLADFTDARGEVFAALRPAAAGMGRAMQIEFRNLTGRAHDENRHVLLSATVLIEEGPAGTVRILYGDLKSKGGAAGFTFAAGIADASGTLGYVVPGCESGCTVAQAKERHIVYARQNQR